MATVPQFAANPRANPALPGKRRAALASLPALLLFAIAASSGCGAGSDANPSADSGSGAGATDGAAADAGALDAAPPLLEYAAPLVLPVERVFDTGGTGDPLGFLAPLPSEGVGMSRARTLYLLAAGSPVPDELGNDVGVVRALLAVGRGLSAQVLVGGDKGLFSVVAGILERSPLAASLGSAAVRALLDSGEPSAPAVWIVTDDAIRLFRGGTLRAVHVEVKEGSGQVSPVDPAAARYAVCRDGAGGRLVILPSVGSDRLLSLSAAAVAGGSGGTVPLATHVVGHPVTLVACDNRGVVLAVTGDQLLVEVGPDGALRSGRLPEPVQALVADPDAAGAWLGVNEGGVNGMSQVKGKVVYGRLGSLQPVEADWTPFLADDPGLQQRGIPSLVADLGGPLLVSSPRRVGRLRPVVVVELRGLPAGPPPLAVSEPLALDVSAPFPSAVRALAADLDGVAQFADVAARRVVINPWSIAEGVHTLTVTVTYKDAAPLSATASLRLGRPPTPPGWARDVEPIYAARCRKCHGPNGSGHLMASADRWQAEIKTILSSVADRRMPLPPNDPLSGVEIAKIAGWSVTSFSP